MKRSFASFLALALVSAWLAQPARADYKQAVAYYNQGQFDKAIQAIKPDVDQNPDWEVGHRLLGLSYLALKNNALAVSSLSRAVQLKSKEFSTYYGLGLAYFNMQRYDNAITALNQGEPLASEKDKIKLSSLRGKACFQTKRYSQAVDDLTASMRSGQADWSDYYMLGMSYLNLNRTDEAIQTLEKVQAMKPGQSAVIETLGKAYFKKGVAALAARQYGPAVQYLLKAKDYDPKNGYIFYNLAEAYLFEKKYADAEKALNQSAALMPRSMEVYSRMGLVYEKQKKWDAALNAYRKAEEISPSKAIKESIARVTENKKQ